MSKVIQIPTVELENKTWLLLKHLSDSWTIRSFDMDRNRHEAKEKTSGHKVFEIDAKGAVRCTPKKQWDIENYKF